MEKRRKKRIANNRKETIEGRRRKWEKEVKKESKIEKRQGNGEENEFLGGWIRGRGEGEGKEKIEIIME